MSNSRTAGTVTPAKKEFLRLSELGQNKNELEIYLDNLIAKSGFEPVLDAIEHAFGEYQEASDQLTAEAIYNIAIAAEAAIFRTEMNSSDLYDYLADDTRAPHVKQSLLFLLIVSHGQVDLIKQTEELADFRLKGFLALHGQAVWEDNTIAVLGLNRLLKMNDSIWEQLETALIKYERKFKSTVPSANADHLLIARKTYLQKPVTENPTAVFFKHAEIDQTKRMKDAWQKTKAEKQIPYSVTNLEFNVTYWISQLFRRAAGPNTGPIMTEKPKQRRI